ncbi:unnamed protein product [Adineta steineri]|uniref:VLIG-type G domain-containing protein n=1 Tax=Adineta steineri TaxID=433720 RepID=A0A814GP62_9BILA|nr:unnamed protein product [Adineta steineri]CAF1111470.1 unnamed protein product [Adineta steineri]
MDKSLTKPYQTLDEKEYIETVQIIDIKKCLNPDNVVVNYLLDRSYSDIDDEKLFSNSFKFLHGYHQTPNETLDVSFNQIVDEPLSAEKLIEIINNNQSLTPYVVDSLKRYHALHDMHTIISQCLDLQNDINDKTIGDQFEDLIDNLTTRVLLTITIESMSYESQRLLANFIKRNDLPIPFTYYAWNPILEELNYQINFNCLIEPLCLTSDRLYLQIGSDRCAGLGKTSLLPLIFNDKRNESLFTDGDRKYRNSCIDILFGKTKQSSYTIFDVHGTIDEKNISLIKAIQVYTALQVIYVTEDDLPNPSSNSKNDFLNTVMNYSSYSLSIPTIVVIFSSDFDKEDKTQQLINRFQNHYANKHFSNIYWSVSSMSTTMKDLSKPKRRRYVERLKSQFSELLEEVEGKTTATHLQFRSCFSIQELYLNIKNKKPNDKYTELKRIHVKFDIENRLEELFKSSTDQTENLKIMTPTSYYRSEMDTIKKKKLSNIINNPKVIEELDIDLRKLENEKRSNAGFTRCSLFTLELLNNRTYIDLLITDFYLEKWRLKYVPGIKEEKEKIKSEINLHKKKLVEQQKLVDQENESAAASNESVDQKFLNDFKMLCEEDKRLKDQLVEVDKKLANVDLTIGLFCDELFELYDYFHDNQPVELENALEDFIKVAKNIAKLVNKGFPIHILRSRPLICQSRLMKMVLENLFVKEASRLVILTIVGEQSSAKSSLLNSTFGCNFRVSAGRCTIGMYLGIVYHKDLAIMILDTEGLMSLEESGSIFDSQMITMAILTSHLVLINHNGELSSNLEGLIGISLYTKLQIQLLPFKPKLLFILRDQMSRDEKIFLEQLSEFKDNLQTSSNFLKVSIDDKCEIKQDNIVVLPSAFNKDFQKEINIIQRWRNQTFAYEINQLRKYILDYFHKQHIHDNFGLTNIDALYNKISSNWKTIDELGQGLLECKSLAELNVTNELKSKANEIIQEKSKLLFEDGTKLLHSLLMGQTQTTEPLNNNSTNNTQVSSDIYLKNFIEDGFEKLHDLTCKLIKDAIDDYEQSAQSYYADIKSNIQKNIEPRILCTEQLLKQRFEQDVYTIAKENAALEIQKQLLNTARIYFDKQTQTITDINELNAVLDERYKELYKKFEGDINLLKKSESDITKTIINIYNGIIRTRRGTTANQYDIYNLCLILDPRTYPEKFHELESIYVSIQSYLTYQQKSNKTENFLKHIFSTNPWKTHRKLLGWFNHLNRDDEYQKKMFLSISEGLIPQVNNNINTMLLTIKLSYNDPQLITNLIQYVDDSIKMQTSPIQQYWTYLNVPQITADLIRMALRFLIDQAKQIADRKHEELKQELNQLKEWKINIQEQFLSFKDSFEQGQKFKTDLQKQIIEEIKRIYTRIIIDDVHTKITNNSEIDPDKIATNAYNDSIGSNPPNANNIMKYIIDINRYYLELALNKIQISKETIVTNEIHRLEKIIYNCVDKAIETVEKHDCHNIQQVYQDIVKNLQQILPGFRLSPMIGISTKIKDPDRFKESFKQLLLGRTKMYQEIIECKNIFATAATESCINLIKTRLGCQSRCPGCGTKCDNTEINHTEHYSLRHLGGAFYGWKTCETSKPYLCLCYQLWLTTAVYHGETKFHPRQKYFSERTPAWFDDLEQKSKTGDLYNDSTLPLEQRRAWMAVRHALIKRYSTSGMKDFENYNEKFYPNIESVSADFEPKWNDIQS